MSKFNEVAMRPSGGYDDSQIIYEGTHYGYLGYFPTK